jgi:hypothetical protein
VKAQGENAKARVSLGAQIGVSTIEKLMAGTYGRVPKQAMRERLAMFFGVPEESLFPLAAEPKSKRSAS